MIKKIGVLFLVFLMTFTTKASTTDIGFVKKDNYVILVEKNEDKKLYADLAYIKSARYKIEIISLEDLSIDYDKEPKEIATDIHTYLEDRQFELKGGVIDKDPIKYLLLDDTIPAGFVPTGVKNGKNIFLWSDYYYGYLMDGFYVKDDVDYIKSTTDEYPNIIVSRMDRKQLKYWSLAAKIKRLQALNSVSAFPIVCFRQEGDYEGGCSASVMHIDHSYYGDYLKQIFYDNNIQVTTLYETRYSKLSGDTLRTIKPIKQPDFSLSKSSFQNSLQLSNIILLGCTVERVYIQDDLYITAYRDDFVTSIWNDKNEDCMADDDEVEIESIKKYSEMNKDNVKRFYFAPTGGYKINNPDFPISIRPKFDFPEGPQEISDPWLWYQHGWDPEGSNITTVWAGILREIAAGKTFAEANLKGYRNYAVYIKERKDPNSQAANALKLFCYGPPDETIYDLAQQPYLKVDDIIIKPRVNPVVVVENLGDKDLKFKIIDHSDNIDTQDINIQKTVKPMQKVEINFSVKKQDGFLCNRLPIKKFGWITIESNDSFWKTKKVSIAWNE
jgi:hypothetical protein